jgi:hypothetical protein
MLYELANGTRPFEGSTDGLVIDRILNAARLVEEAIRRIPKFCFTE